MWRCFRRNPSIDIPVGIPYPAVTASTDACATNGVPSPFVDAVRASRQRDQATVDATKTLEELEMLRTRLASEERKRDELQAEVDRLGQVALMTLKAKDQNAMVGELAESRAIITDLRKEVDLLTKQRDSAIQDQYLLSGLREINEKLTNERDALETTAMEYCAEVISTSHRGKELASELEESRKSNSALRSTIKILQERITEIDTQCKDARSMETTMSALKESNKQLTADRDSWEKSAMEYRKAVECARDEKVQCANSFACQLAESRETIDALRREINALSKKHEDTAKREAEARSDASLHQSRIQELSLQLNDRESQSNKALENMKSEHQTVVDKLIAQIDEQNISTEELEKWKIACRKETERCKGLTQKCDSLEACIKSMKSKHEVTSAKLLDVTKKFEDGSFKYSVLQSNFNALKDEIKTKNASIQSLEKEQEHLRQTARDMQADNESLADVMNEYRNQRDEANERLSTVLKKQQKQLREGKAAYIHGFYEMYGSDWRSTECTTKKGTNNLEDARRFANQTALESESDSSDDEENWRAHVDAPAVEPDDNHTKNARRTSFARDRRQSMSMNNAHSKSNGIHKHASKRRVSFCRDDSVKGRHGN